MARMAFSYCSLVPGPALKRMEILPHPLLFRTPLGNGAAHLNAECPLSADFFFIVPAAEFHFACALSVRLPYHSFFITWSEESPPTCSNWLAQAATRDGSLSDIPSLRFH